MSAYTLAGYGVAIWQRSNKTILVEGQSDKRVLDRLLLERHLVGALTQPCLVDQVDLINDPALSQLGNKDRVLQVIAGLGNTPGITSRLNYLVDREWEAVPTNPVPQQFGPLPSAQWGTKTKGHSIENYAFRVDVLGGYLRQWFATDLPPVFFTEFQLRFDHMMRLAASVSLAASANGLITRCGSLFRATDVGWTGGRYEPRNSVNEKLTARQANFDLAAAAIAIQNRADVVGCSADVLRWIAHGHLGEQVLRACVADLAREFGAVAATVSTIETGRKLEKQLYEADQMSKWSDMEIEPLDELVAWSS